jgi:hypothetical protein
MLLANELELCYLSRSFLIRQSSYVSYELKLGYLV